jgi:hypothetical protein
MSRYEWEAGTIKIPSAEWAKTKAAIRDAMNRRQTALFVTAEKAHAELVQKLPDLKKQLKAKTLSDWDYEKAIDRLVDRHMETYRYSVRGNALVFDPSDGRDILDKIYVDHDPKTRKAISPKLRKPLKKDFPLAGNNVNSFQADDCSLVFDNEARSVRWQVYDNNHARDHAYATVLGNAFFDAMKKITWTRDSGGTIVGNDEYNQDAGREYEGGGGSYVTHRFSADEQKREREAEARARNSYGGYGMGGYGGYRGRYR